MRSRLLRFGSVWLKSNRPRKAGVRANLPLELLAERRRIIAEIVLAEFVLPLRRALGVLPFPTKPRPAGVWLLQVLPEAGRPAAGWGAIFRARLRQPGELQAEHPQSLARRVVIGLRVRLRRPQSVVELAGTSVELVGHGEVENRLRSFLDGADGRDAALAHHGRGHVGRGMQAVRRHCRGIELACEIERKHDLGELALSIGARAAVTARQHAINEVDRVLAERRGVHDEPACRASKAAAEPW